MLVRPEQLFLLQEQHQPAKPLQHMKVLEVKVGTVQQRLELAHRLVPVGRIRGFAPQSQSGRTQRDAFDERWFSAGRGLATMVR